MYKFFDDDVRVDTPKPKELIPALSGAPSAAFQSLESSAYQTVFFKLYNWIYRMYIQAFRHPPVFHHH